MKLSIPSNCALPWPSECVRQLFSVRVLLCCKTWQPASLLMQGRPKANLQPRGKRVKPLVREFFSAVTRARATFWPFGLPSQERVLRRLT